MQTIKVLVIRVTSSPRDITHEPDWRGSGGVTGRSGAGAGGRVLEGTKRGRRSYRGFPAEEEGKGKDAGIRDGEGGELKLE